MRLALADGDATNRAQDRMQDPLVIIFLVDDVADWTWAGELQNKGIHPTDVIGHEKKAAGRQVFQTQRSDSIKAAHQWPPKEIKRAFGSGHFASHRSCHSERSEESLTPFWTDRRGN